MVPVKLVDITNKIGVELISYYIDNNKKTENLHKVPILVLMHYFKKRKVSIYTYRKHVLQRNRSATYGYGVYRKSDFDYDCMIEFIWSNYTCLCCGGNYNQLCHMVSDKENALCPGCNSLRDIVFMGLYQ